MKKSWLIYCHINKINGKRYIGQTSQGINKLNLRWSNGLGYKSNKIFYRAIQKYGWNNFEHIILEENIPTVDEANIREQYWIAYYNTCISNSNSWGYNRSPGGNALSEESKKKISNTLKGHIVSEETKLKLSKAGKANPVCYWQGKKRSPETLEKLRKAKLGTVISNSQKEKIISSLIDYYKTDSASNTVRKDGTILTQKVLCVESGEIFFSVNEAARQKSYKHNTNGAGHIKDCLNGKRKTAYGFHWKKVD